MNYLYLLCILISLSLFIWFYITDVKKSICQNVMVTEHYRAIELTERYNETRAPMHDLGKIGVDDAILRKRGKFTEDEYSVMKKHSAIGGKMIKDILTDVEEKDFVKVSQNVAHYHHEKFDGSGYPDGLKGEEIPLSKKNPAAISTQACPKFS